MPILVEETVFFVSVGSQNTCWIRPAFWFIWLPKLLRKFQAVQLSSLLIKKTINSYQFYNSIPPPVFFSFYSKVFIWYICSNPFGGAWPPWYPKNPWPNPWPKPPHPPAYQLDGWGLAQGSVHAQGVVDFRDGSCTPGHTGTRKNHGNPWGIHGESPIPPYRAAQSRASRAVSIGGERARGNLLH